jgi:DNA polymerase-3 subunit delta'
MSFSEVIGQKEAEERLMQMVKEDRLPHALMLCGPQGSGKLPLAVAFASYLLDNGTPSAKAMLWCMKARSIQVSPRRPAYPR